MQTPRLAPDQCGRKQGNFKLLASDRMSFRIPPSEFSRALLLLSRGLSASDCFRRSNTTAWLRLVLLLRLAPRGFFLRGHRSVVLPMGRSRGAARSWFGEGDVSAKPSLLAPASAHFSGLFL